MIRPHPNQKGWRLEKGENNEDNQKKETNCEGKGNLEQSVVKHNSIFCQSEKLDVNEPWALLGSGAHAPVHEHSR